jgi:TupA-like ATPgrasp
LKNKVRMIIRPLARIVKKLLLGPKVEQKVVQQLEILAVTGNWPDRPPDGTLRGVDFYSAKALVRVIACGAQTFKDRHGCLPNLVFPETFSEHIFVRKFFAPLPMPSLANKLAAYEYVKAQLGDAILPSVVWTGDNLSELLKTDLPTGRFVLKANHGSGFILFVNAPDDLVVKHIEIEKASTQWLETRFGYDRGEWQYCTFKPKLFLERFIDFNQGNVPHDFKLYCFNGYVCLIEIGINRFAQLGTAFYDRSWKQIPVGYGEREPIQYQRPENLDEMIAIAETITRPMQFARIDLYSDGKRNIKFGEITFTPGNALSRYTRRSSRGTYREDFAFDRWLGAFFRQTPPISLSPEKL